MNIENKKHLFEIYLFYTKSKQIAFKWHSSAGISTSIYHNILIFRKLPHVFIISAKLICMNRTDDDDDAAAPALVCIGCISTSYQIYNLSI